MARVNKPTVKAAPKPAAKSVPNVVARTITESTDIEAAKEATTVIAQSGARTDEVIEAEGDVYGFADKAEKLAFLEEPVKIIIHDSTDRNAEQYAFCAVNGVGAGPNGVPYLPRGREIVIKRKYVGVLASARPVRIKQKPLLSMNGEPQMEYSRASSDLYPFAVLHDTPKGHEWLRRIRTSQRA